MNNLKMIHIYSRSFPLPLSSFSFSPGIPSRGVSFSIICLFFSPNSTDNYCLYNPEAIGLKRNNVEEWQKQSTIPVLTSQSQFSYTTLKKFRNMIKILGCIQLNSTPTRPNMGIQPYGTLHQAVNTQPDSKQEHTKHKSYNILFYHYLTNIF